MADKDSEQPERALARKIAEKQNPNRSMEGDAQLSSNDHRVLERAIRGTVSSMVGAGHPDLALLRTSHDIDSEHELSLHSERNPVARQMPGTDQAIAFRGSLLKCLVDPDPRHHRQFIQELQSARLQVQTLAVHLFAPVATQLGDLWCNDEADFMQVAVASTRLNTIVNHLSHSSNAPVNEHKEQRRMLLARSRGAMHTLGVSIVASCFRDMGWAVDGGGDLEIDDSIYTRLSQKPYNLLGISVGRIDEVGKCSEAVRRVQSDPKTRRTKIAVGGPAVVASPQAFQRIGVDFVTRSALDMIQIANHI